LRGLSPLPCTPAFLAGLVNIRGRIVPVIDIKRFLDLPQRGIADLHHVVLVGNGHIEIGLLADAIDSVHAIDAGALQAPVSAFPEGRDGYFKGIAPDRTVVLDMAAILADERLVVDEEVEI
jgi:purine-binding chemotaxis protein CheW